MSRRLPFRKMCASLGLSDNNENMKNDKEYIVEV